MHYLADGYLGDAGDFLLINRFAQRTGWLHTPMKLIAGEGLIVFVLFIGIGWWLARRRSDLLQMAAVAWTGIATLLAVAINQPIVNSVAEARPYTSIPQILVLVSRSADYSFPSDHATMAGAVATGLLYVNRRLGVITWCAAVLLAFSRVYVGAHYPHDVAVGLALGAAVVVLGRPLARPLLNAATAQLARTPLRPVLLADEPGSMHNAPAARQR